MKELTKAEEQIMHRLWQMDNATVRQIIDQLPEPAPAYNTVSTIVRILERKGFVDHIAEGKGHVYFTIISKQEYTRKFMKRFISNYFENSFKNLVSFFAKNDKMDLNEFDDLVAEVRKELENNKNKRQ
ncbi:BlaI/MecI/CopY family transcriptional regulator [Marinilabilia rubra]|uniref:CopY family transcriptional repressor n=1 Tax=Marinilabilia rubra TaxID=2162893 RepID=A0A2U2BAF9_9BACT|nr:BlaI/MecI/CopY family transcriptional regulator [Marinilabilia rubra]PWE00055.1 CopY family transcriptional repressor [Marinilabilia rubra]